MGDTSPQDLFRKSNKARIKREREMPDEAAAINVMMDAYCRLKELGWSEAQYCPKDGTHFRVIENGSTGIFDCVYEGKWPNGHWTTSDDGDCYPSSIAPALYRLYPEDEAKHKAKMAEAIKRFAGETDPLRGGDVT